MDRGAWGATVHTAARSQTLLKQFSTHTHMTNRASHEALVVKNLPANAGDIRDADSIPGWGRYPEVGHGNPLQDPCLESPHGERNLAGYSLLGSKESEKTQRLSMRAPIWETSLKPNSNSHVLLRLVYLWVTVGLNALGWALSRVCRWTWSRVWC